MSKLFMYGTSLEGLEELAVECTNYASLSVAFLGIPDMRPTTIYSINRVRTSMTLVPNFHPRRSGIVINNYFNFKGGAKDCNGNVISVSNECLNCGYINSNLQSNVDELKY